MKANNVPPRPPQHPDTMPAVVDNYASTANQQANNIYPNYAPANPPAYDEAITSGVNMDQITVGFTNHVNVQASAPYPY